jgi:lysophospholipase L1-like esterase
MKLAFLGDSLTWGGYGGSFMAELSPRLPHHELTNAGEGGNTVINLLRRLDGVLEQEPDGIFVMVGGNDAISHSQPKTRRYYEIVQQVPGGAVSPTVFVQAYRDLLTRIQLAQVQVWAGLPPIEYNRAVIDTLRAYNQMAQETAQALGVDTLDLMQLLPPPDSVPDRPPLDQAAISLVGRRLRQGWADFEAERDRNGFTFTFDGLHLTPDAASTVAEYIADFLDKALSGAA